MTAMARALRTGGVMAFPISSRSSSTCTTILRILLGMSVPRVCGARSALAVPLADVGGLQATDAGVDARAGAHGQDVDDLVRQRCARHADLDRIEVAAHVDGVDVGQR